MSEPKRVTLTEAREQALKAMADAEEGRRQAAERGARAFAPLPVPGRNPDTETVRYARAVVRLHGALLGLNNCYWNPGTNRHGHGPELGYQPGFRMGRATGIAWRRASDALESLDDGPPPTSPEYVKGAMMLHDAIALVSQHDRAAAVDRETT